MKDRIEKGQEDRPGIIYLDITGEDGLEELTEDGIIEALTGSEFKSIITEHLFSHLEEAIKKEKNSFIAFRLPEQEEDYILEERQYKDLLNTILKMVEEEEDYKKCATIKKLIETL
tara:strand:+ start:367 stop:714 length:348 start_codon:yes stop_codon:yes gene_type:complete